MLRFTSRRRLIGAIPVLLLAAAPAPISKKVAFVLQDKVDRPEPFRASLLKVNPPTFRWPEDEEAGKFQVEISRSSAFKTPLTADVTEAFYRPLKPFAPGAVWWRYRPARNGRAGPWSAAESFEIGPDLPKWEVAEWKTLIARVPRTHPRVGLRPEEVEKYRKLAQGPLRERVERWAKHMERVFGEEFSLAKYEAEVPKDANEGLAAFQMRVKRRWAAKAAGGDLMSPVTDLCWLWLVTGDAKFATEAKRRLMIATGWDPEAFVSHRNSDFGNASIVSNGAVAYDLLYGQLSPEERAKVRKMLVARTQPLMEDMKRNSRRLMNAHAWQHTFFNAMQSAVALYGEEPVAAEWVELGLKSFVALFPWFGGADGGSQEGANYYTGMELLSSLETRDLFLAAFGIDFAKDNPWYRANPYYLIYSYPPGGMISQIADSGRGATQPGWKEKLGALRMASLYENGHAADYAARIVEQNERILNADSFRWFSATAVKSAPLEALPAARCFRDIGVVFMHSAYTRPEENVRMEFRSSPFGGAGHGHADQNSFHIIAYNEPLLIDSGYYTPAGDPHHAGWTTQTKAHNSILVDGTGQPDNTTGHGTIRHFEENEKWVYSIGSAPAAYKEVDLERFDRHVVWLKGGAVQTYVIVDDLRAGDGKAHRFDWLLHAEERMDVDQTARRISVRGKKGEALVTLLEPAQLSFDQHDKFDQPAIDWRRGRTATELKKQWHLRATPPPSAAQRFVAVIQVAKPGVERAEVRAIPDGAQVGGWTVRLAGGKLQITPPR